MYLVWNLLRHLGLLELHAAELILYTLLVDIATSIHKGAGHVVIMKPGWWVLIYYCLKLTSSQSDTEQCRSSDGCTCDLSTASIDISQAFDYP